MAKCKFNFKSCEKKNNDATFMNLLRGTTEWNFKIIKLPCERTGMGRGLERCLKERD
jgi:hypothetical protein